MNIRFLRTYNKDREEKYISFWSGVERKYSFEITHEDTEDVELFVDELKLNLENQFDLENIHKA